MLRGTRAAPPIGRFAADAFQRPYGYAAAMHGLRRLLLCGCLSLWCAWTLTACRAPQAVVSKAGPASPAEPPLPPAQVDPTLTRSHLRAQVAERPPLSARPQSCQIAVLHVQIPAARGRQAEALWNHLRQDVLDADTRYRLRLNGLRVGVGSVRFWEPIRLVLDAIEGRRVVQSQPVRVPPGFPVRLELSDPQPEETIFVVASDGVISGQTFTDARNVLRVEYHPDPRRADRLIVRVVPEIHRDHQGWRWVRTESGLWQVPDREQTALPAAAFQLSLAQDEFIVLAPADEALAAGLVGSTFLQTGGPQGAYNSYVFVRPNVTTIDTLAGNPQADANPTDQP